ncbi:MAG: D-glycerate dehydrogenase [Bacteroidetes bacterium]|nr:D-glycerate dehydrogenase [Bacteroidota bacterium]
MKVYITRKISPIAESLLKKEGYSVSVFKKDCAISKDELMKKSRDVDALISQVTDTVDAEVITNLKNCKVIAQAAVGVNNIDLSAARERGIIVTNTPDVLTDATADLAAALILSCARRIVEGDNYVREGKFDGWKPQLMLGMELRGKTLGIIGAGRIGQETAKRIKAFGVKIIYYNKSRKADFEKKTDAQKVSLKVLLKTSDIVSVHLPLKKETYRILNSDNLKLMRKGVVFVNTARGEVVEERALIKLIKSGHIFSAGFDVYENEPDVNKQLFKLKNVILLPHIGSGTVEARSKMAELAALNAIKVLNGKNPLTEVK